MNVKLGKRLLTALLALVMALSLLPGAAFATEGNDGISTQAEGLENLVLNKTAQLKDDGTYTIQLEAYAKGQVNTTTTVTREPVPTDFILILDQSGSMTDEDYYIDGIPDGTYTQVNGTVTNEQLSNGNYYYKVGDNYYKVHVTRELIGSEVKWVGQDGKTYTEDQLSYSWSRKSDGQVYNTATPFVTESLKTYTRTKGTGWQSLRVYYVNDYDSNDTTNKAGVTSAAGAREEFLAQKKTATNTVEFHNDGGNYNDWDKDNPFYVAAVYTAVTQETVNTYRYTYTYVDGSGQTRTIGASADNAQAGDPADVSPLYTQNSGTGPRLDALKYAANNFIDSIQATGVDHRVAVVGFATGDYTNNNNYPTWENTELFVGSNQYNYYNGRTGSNYAANHYDEAFQNVQTEAGRANLDASIDALAGRGATYPQYGFIMAGNVYNAYANDSSYTTSTGDTAQRNRVVIFLTDGVPGYSSYDSDVASAAVTQSTTLQNTYDATVYVVACMDSVSNGSNQDNFLKDVSSDGTYQIASTATALDEFFATTAGTVTDTTIEASVSLSEQSYLVDELSSYFVVPEGFSVNSNVKVQVAKHTGYESFANPTDAPSGVTATLRTDSTGTVTGINVTGFNYISEENVVTTDASGGSVKVTGNKLVVTITGLLARDEAATSTYIDTNTANSGIWDYADAAATWVQVKPFNMPTTYLDKKTFVLDYAKETSLDVYSATRVDSADDGIFSKVNETSTEISGSYGKADATKGLTYAPTTTNWNGWESFYALGKDNTYGDNVTKNIWSKVSVLPANNVYYEDDFISSEATGTVGIVYDGNWTTVGEADNNAGEVDGTNDATDTADGNHGWIESKDNDTGYSDGAAHEGTTGATATFTFTGTGVDVYSRTNGTTGIVTAILYAGQGDEMVMKKALTIDNLAQSGDYYQIPTLFFGGLLHGTYTVKLTVTAAAEGRTTYYLDGIRVYNPLSETQESDTTVEEAYDDEIGASFQSVRDILIDATTDEAEFNNGGVVFIDYNPEVSNEDNSAVLGTYVDYGPKNEVYLDTNQAVYLNVGTEFTGKLAIGLKGPEGATTAAQVTNGEATSTITIHGASDQYYTITPDDSGNVIIKNTGDNLLSVTKIKQSGYTIESYVLDMPMMTSYAATFDSLPVVDYVPAGEDAEEPVEETPAEEETPTEEPGDVVIENPEEPVEEEPQEPVSNSWVDKLFSAIKKLFGR